jgi:glutamate 5-kinase
MLKTLSLKIVVVKIGTKVLSGKDYCLDQIRIKELVSQISDIVNKGIKVVVVTSGAICCGTGLLGLKKRPDSLSELQTCAAVGQANLMQTYDTFFKTHNILTAQILLTQEDLSDRKRYLNAKATILTLLKRGVVPIVNENDTVSTDEIRFGDNDKLSSLVANLIAADLLILLSNVDGLYRNTDKTPIAVVDKVTGEIEAMAQRDTDDLGTGGMVSKLQAARIATNSGISCIIANGKKDNVLKDIISGDAHGTLFLPSSTKMAARKRWIGFSTKPKGAINVDNGAKEALVKKNKSLLSSGIMSSGGGFKKGDVISIVDLDGEEFARGISNYSFNEIEKIKGLKTTQISKALGYKNEDEVVHKDNLVIL